jgi:hypothetical protein
LPEVLLLFNPGYQLISGDNRDLGENIVRERKKEGKKESKRVRRYNIMFS